MTHESNNPIDLRSVTDEGTREVELEKREQFLRTFGFSDEWINDLKKEKPTLYSTIHVEKSIDDLKTLGFTDPTKMITSLPSILGLHIENIKGKIDDLKTLGFTDPTKMITSAPSILGLHIENIKGKIDDLKTLGFTDPTKMITSLPSILGLHIENIKGKIDDLKTLGFTDPTKMITSLPSILGLHIENIKGKIDTLNTLIKLYAIPIEANQFIEKNLSLLGTKIDKVWIIARMLKTLDFNPGQITEAFLSRLLFSNVTNVVVAVSLLKKEVGKDVTKEEVLKAIKEAKVKSDEEKKTIVTHVDPKLRHRYERGYGN